MAYAQTMVAAEISYSMPYNGWCLFMARAWVFGDKGPALAPLVDVSWVQKGDFYFIHRLAEAIKAYRGVTWVRPGNGKTPAQPRSLRVR